MEFPISNPFNGLGIFCSFPRFNINLCIVDYNRFHFVTVGMNLVPLRVSPYSYFLDFLRSTVHAHHSSLLGRSKYSVI
jgi:hypothetical protein